MSDAAHDQPAWPSVSVVIPVRNEARHLESAVAAVLGQGYPGTLDVCLAVAPSSDDTAAIADRLARDHREVSVVANATGLTAAGLNRAIAATAGEVVVRVDGHARLSPGYIVRAVETMRRTGAVNVGGIQDPRGTTTFEHAVAVAMSSWAGTGGSRFHVGGPEGPVDTVYLGVFGRSALERVGAFDETLVRNQDYELNIRLRADGGTIWFDPELRVEYQPRSTWRSLARQYFEYGWWKAEVVGAHPGSIRPRQVAPVVLLLALTLSTLVPGRRLRLPATYVATVGALAAADTRLDRGASLRFVVVVPTMHLAWAVGFLASVARRARSRPALSS